MSGPVGDYTESGSERGLQPIEVREGRSTTVAGTGILRVLPTKRRRAIGPWCFTDLIRPEDVETPPPLEIGPHPHIGLATVTWLFAGAVLHTDSLGTEQPIRPGELNLMTSGGGVSHAEEGIDITPGAASGGIMGAQMWLAQTEATRHGRARFEHHTELPVAPLQNGQAHLIIGGLDGVASPVRTDHGTIGMEVTFDGTSTVPLDPAFEHAVVPIDRPIRVADEIVEPGSLAFAGTGRTEIDLASRSGRARVMVLGGVPLDAPLTMWWNFVARSKDEITEAWRDWNDRNEDRFGRVPTKLHRIEAPRPPWVTPTG